jgi:hypothetical protein
MIPTVIPKTVEFVPRSLFRGTICVVSVLKQQQRKAVQSSAPNLLFMGRAGRFIVDILDSGGIESLMESHVSIQPTLFLRPHTQPKYFDLAVELDRLRHDAAVRGFRIYEDTAGGAEAADIGELIQMFESGLQSLHPAEEKPGHGPVIAVEQGAETGGVGVTSAQEGEVVSAPRAINVRKVRFICLSFKNWLSKCL